MNEQNNDSKKTGGAAHLKQRHENMLALVADADMGARTCFAQCLKNAGLDVVEAADDAEVLAKSAEMHPDVILLDGALPGVGGIECLQHIRAKEETKRISVIICSSDTRREFIIQCAKAGANEFVVKPVEVQSMLEKIVVVLNRRHDSHAKESGAASNPASEKTNGHANGKSNE